MNKNIKIIETTPPGISNGTYLSDLFVIYCNEKSSCLKLNFSYDTDFEINLAGDLTGVVKSNRDCFEIILLAGKMGQFVDIVAEFNLIKGRNILKAELKRLLF